jgi:7-cyano-7-deazaguanine synthase
VHAAEGVAVSGAAGSPAVVLLSGGLDSATVLAVATRDGHACHCLAFDYGQRHRHELQCARRIASHQKAASFRVVTLGLREIGGSALTADIDVPKDRTDRDLSTGIPVTYVPARNLTFLAIASGLAEVLGARAIYAGVNAVDYSGYPDCRPEFIRSVEQTISLGTKAGVEGESIEVRTPIIRLTKPEIIRLGVSLGVDYGLTSSCYDPAEGGLACGHCDSCQIRRRGFVEAGVADPTRYAEGDRR